MGDKELKLDQNRIKRLQEAPPKFKTSHLADILIAQFTRLRVGSAAHSRSRRPRNATNNRCRRAADDSAENLHRKSVSAAGETSTASGPLSSDDSVVKPAKSHRSAPSGYQRSHSIPVTLSRSMFDRHRQRRFWRKRLVIRPSMLASLSAELLTKNTTTLTGGKVKCAPSKSASQQRATQSYRNERQHTLTSAGPANDTGSGGQLRSASSSGAVAINCSHNNNNNHLEERAVHRRQYRCRSFSAATAKEKSKVDDAENDGGTSSSIAFSRRRPSLSNRDQVIKSTKSSQMSSSLHIAVSGQRSSSSHAGEANRDCLESRKRHNSAHAQTRVNSVDDGEVDRSVGGACCDRCAVKGGGAEDSSDRWTKYRTTTTNSGKRKRSPGLSVNDLTGAVEKFNMASTSSADQAAAAKVEDKAVIGGTVANPYSCGEQVRLAVYSDVTADELAGYLEDTTFFPKRMSYMAEMMYT